MKRILFILFLFCVAAISTQAQLTAPTISAAAKSSDQINLTWSAASAPGYGYLVEIQSAGDSRYSSFTQLQSIPSATGYTHSAGNACTTDDPTGAYVYNPASLGRSAYLYGLPTWVVESNYLDPQDGSAAQFIAFGLKPNVSYSFRVRTYTPIGYSSYSNTASATTANYTQRFVNTATGSDSNGGTNSTTDAWLTINHAASTVTAGTVVLVEAGNYAADQIFTAHSGTSGNKIVFEADTGASVTITTPYQGAQSITVTLQNSYVVVDGINIVDGVTGDFSVYVTSDHDVLTNMGIGPNMSGTIPANYNGIDISSGSYALVYQVYSHDGGIPCSAQNPNGDNGWVISENPGNHDVIWFNHFTRGAHDTGLTKGVDGTHKAENNRWLDNVMDGGYGLGWEDVFYGDTNLFEGNVPFYVGVLEAGIYKPGIEISGPSTTVRRNTIVKPASHALEISNLNSINIPNFLAYNNIFYTPTTACFWINSAVTSASGVIANNICNSTIGAGVCNASTLDCMAYSYTTDTTDTITHNDLVYITGGVAYPATANIVWDTVSGGYCSASGCNLSGLESNLNPPWSNNLTYAVVPLYGNASSYDFHLVATSTLLGQAATVTDSTWGTIGNTNIGAFDGTFAGGSQLSAGTAVTAGVKMQ